MVKQINRVWCTVLPKSGMLDPDQIAAQPFVLAAPRPIHECVGYAKVVWLGGNGGHGKGEPSALRTALFGGNGGQGRGEPSALRTLPPGGNGGHGKGEPSALRTALFGGNGGHGRGEPSALRMLPPGGNGGQGNGEPSATVDLLTSYLPLLDVGSRMRTARNNRANRIVSFFTR